MTSSLSPVVLYAPPDPIHGKVSRAGGAIAVLIGATVLLGWAVDSALLRALGPGSSAAMNPTSAFLLVLSGMAIWLLSVAPTLYTRSVGRGIAIVVMVVGIGRLAREFAASPLPVDALLFPEAMRQTADGRSNAMAPNAAFDFVLIAIALQLMGRRSARAVVAAQAMAVVVLLSSMIALTAYVYESGWFETIGRFNRMAFGTAIAFLALSIGTIALQDEHGLLSVVLSDGPGGTLARSLLPAGLFVPALFGWLTLESRRQGLVGTDAANMVFVAAITVVFAALICWNAIQLHESHTVRLRTEAALRESEERFRLIAENGNDVVMLLDLGGRVAYTSPSCERVIGFLPDELQRMTPFALVHPDDAERLQRQFDALIRGEPLPLQAYRVLHKNGRYVWLETTWRAIAGKDGQVTRLQASARDIGERKEYERQLEMAQRKLTIQQERLLEANAHLERLATVDGLTGLKNRRAFEERLTEEIARSRRTGRPLSLLLLDIDHFKQYNDSFGHPRGDEVLRSMARQLTRTMRDSDCAARYGGEEFALLLPDADKAGAVQLAERLRESVERTSWEGRSVTVSIGIATLSDAIASADLLVEHADRALYRSKQNGRNLVSA